MQALGTDVWVLDACQLLLARKMGIISSLPSLSKDQLDNQNKGDFLVKSLAIGQFLWLLIQLIARTVEDLAISQLEIVTLAFALSTLVTYVLQWSKPKDIQTTVSIAAHRLPTSAEIARIAINGPTVFGQRRSSQWIPNNSCHCDGKAPDFHTERVWRAGSCGAFFLGMMNLIAWLFEFPTASERYLWKIASGVTVYPISACVVLQGLINIALILVGLEGTPTGQRIRIAFSRLLTSVAVPVYLFARVYIIFEMFRCLCFAPPGTFRATWSVNLPHIG